MKVYSWRWGDIVCKFSKVFWTCLKRIVLASLASFASFLIGALLIAAVLSEFENRTIRDVIVYVTMMVIYAVCSYRFHMYNRLKTYAEHAEKFSIQNELISYVRAEGKIIFIIYGIIVGVVEISALIMQNVTPNPILFASTFCLGPWMSLKIPLLRSIIAFTYSAAVICFLAVLRSRKIFQEEISIKRDKNSR
jgi:hypothetical protein